MGLLALHFYLPPEQWQGKYTLYMPRYIDAKGILEGELSNYKALWLPYTIYLEKKVAEVIRRWVKGGGVLIADSPPGLYDEHGYGDGKRMMLSDVFGAEIEGITKFADFLDKTTVHFETKLIPGCPPLVEWTSSEAWKRYKDAAAIFHYRAVKGGKVVATYAFNQKPAIIMNRFGKGKALLLGFPLQAYQFGDAKHLAGMNYIKPPLQRYNKNAVEAMQSLFRWAGVEGTTVEVLESERAQKRGVEVVWRAREGISTRYAIVINYDDGNFIRKDRQGKIYFSANDARWCTSLVKVYLPNNTQTVIDCYLRAEIGIRKDAVGKFVLLRIPRMSGVLLAVSPKQEVEIFRDKIKVVGVQPEEVVRQLENLEPKLERLSEMNTAEIKEVFSAYKIQPRPFTYIYPP